MNHNKVKLSIFNPLAKGELVTQFILLDTQTLIDGGWAESPANEGLTLERNVNGLHEEAYIYQDREGENWQILLYVLSSVEPGVQVSNTYTLDLETRVGAPENWFWVAKNDALQHSEPLSSDRIYRHEAGVIFYPPLPQSTENQHPTVQAEAALEPPSAMIIMPNVFSHGFLLNRLKTPGEQIFEIKGKNPLNAPRHYTDHE